MGDFFVTKLKTEQKIKLKDAFHHISKLISSAVIVILLLIGAFLIYYVINAKIISTRAGVVPKISLYTIVSGSMEPAIKVFDIIVDVRVDDPSSVKIGDVITFVSTSSISENKIVTHRVLDIKIVDGKYEFVTKGDNNPSADSATAKEADLKGKTLFKIPKLGYIQFFIISKIGWLFIILIPAIGIIVFDILKLFNVIEVNENANKLDLKITLDELKQKAENKRIEETIEKIKRNQLK